MECILAVTQNTPFRKKITIRHTDKLRIRSFLGDSNPSDHMTAFNIAMGWAHFNDEEKGAIFCQLYVESLNWSAMTWFSKLSWSIHRVPQALLHVRPARNVSDWSMEDVASESFPTGRVYPYFPESFPTDPLWHVRHSRESFPKNTLDTLSLSSRVVRQ